MKEKKRWEKKRRDYSVVWEFKERNGKILDIYIIKNLFNNHLRIQLVFQKKIYSHSSTFHPNQPKMGRMFFSTIASKQIQPNQLISLLFWHNEFSKQWKIDSLYHFLFFFGQLSPPKRTINHLSYLILW